jgi:hypothetical protein
MTTNRTPLNRSRRPMIDDETLALFRKLESVPKRRREGRAFEAEACALACRLDLGDEHFCSRVSVLDRGPCHTTPDYFAYGAWHKVRAVREQLLAAVKA